jgi:uncharacterized protein YndB with AHSA1/START domain
MSGNTGGGDRVLGTLGSADGKGVIRMEDRYDTGVADLWSALTQPDRLARWLGEFEGDLHVGGEYKAQFFASGWEGTGRVEACDPPHSLRVVNRGTDAPDEHVIEVTLTADGDETILVLEERGMPLDLLTAYGAGIQIHVEDLAAYLAGRDRVDAQARWTELEPLYAPQVAGGIPPSA